jgi:hypothetical protein
VNDSGALKGKRNRSYGGTYECVGTSCNQVRCIWSDTMTSSNFQPIHCAIFVRLHSGPMDCRLGFVLVLPSFFLFLFPISSYYYYSTLFIYFRLLLKPQKIINNNNNNNKRLFQLLESDPPLFAANANWFTFFFFLLGKIGIWYTYP